MAVGGGLRGWVVVCGGGWWSEAVGGGLRRWVLV